MNNGLTHSVQGSSLADILERVLDKGVVVAGDISINLVGVELLTIKLRLLVASVDKAQQLGINWWQHDPYLTSPGQPDLASRLGAIEARLAELSPAPTGIKS